MTQPTNQTGRTGIYREDGGKWRVQIHSDHTDAEGMRRVNLECLAEVRPSPIFGSIKTGGRWESTVLSGNEGIVGWSLTEEN